jgi:hypothetical protein
MAITTTAITQVTTTTIEPQAADDIRPPFGVAFLFAPSRVAGEGTA